MVENDAMQDLKQDHIHFKNNTILMFEFRKSSEITILWKNSSCFSIFPRAEFDFNHHVSCAMQQTEM